MLKKSKYLVLVLMIGLFIQGCENKKQGTAIESIVQAETAISSAKNDANVKKARFSLIEAEKKLDAAKEAYDKKKYDKAKSFAEQASQESKNIIAKAKELKALQGQKPQEKKKQSTKIKGS